MRNAEQIKAEAKEQIKKVLDMCGCYNYTDEGLDKWLDTWEKACSPQIEAIAEKSPYYDEKCKIVFPSEYPRNMNINGIKSFSNWLYDYISRNLEPARIDGYTYNDIIALKNFYKYIEASFYVNNLNPELLEGNLKDIFLFISNSMKSGELYDKRDELDRVYRKFRDCVGIEYYNNTPYLKEDIEYCGGRYAILLAQIIGCDYAQTQFLNDSLVEVLSRNFTKCRFSAGQKLSRAVNNIATKYGFNKDPEWNKEFAKYADSINPLTVTKWTVISWHPLDYLTFCFGNSWSTCSNIDKHNHRGIKIGDSRSRITNYVDADYVFRGEHSAAALSYMFDKTSFIYYTVSKKYNGTHYEEQDKESRIVFSLNEDMDTLLQSRLYPQCNDDNPDDSNYRIPREIIQKVIADALGIPNLWKMKKGYRICSDYALSNGVHYPDYIDERNKECNISWLGEEPKVIHIGSQAICPDCGCRHDYTGSLNCRDCDPEY